MVKTPQWISNFIALVRPSGVALMFLVITLFPIVFAMLEIGIQGVGTRMAGTIAGYFQAIPEIFYDTLQIMFMAYVFGRSGEKIAEQVMSKAGGKTVVQAESADVSVDQRESA